MVNGGGTPQDPIVERLIRLEIEMKAANERSEAHFEALTQRYDAQMAASNQRVTDVMNLLMESIRQTNEGISETNQRIDTAAQDSKEEFARLHRRLDRVDRPHRQAVLRDDRSGGGDNRNAGGGADYGLTGAFRCGDFVSAPGYLSSLDYTHALKGRLARRGFRRCARYPPRPGSEGKSYPVPSVHPCPNTGRTIAKSLWRPVILSEAKNLTHARETLRSAQGDNARDFTIVLDWNAAAQGGYGIVGTRRPRERRK